MAKREKPIFPSGFEDPGLPSGVFSASQYNLYKTCGEAYRRRYVERASRRSGAALVKGVAVHAGAEFSHRALLLGAGLPSLEEAVTAVERSFREGAEEEVDWGGSTETAVLDEARKLYAHYHKQALPKVRPLAVEQHFSLKIGTVPVQGYIDLIDDVGGVEFEGMVSMGQPTVVDLKTSKAAWSQAEADSDPQFTLYSLATKISCVRVDNLVNLKGGPMLMQRTSVRTPHQLQVLTEDYEETADFIKRGIFPKAPLDSWICTPKWCEHWESCRGAKRG
jgi:hypothetical protein